MQSGWKELSEASLRQPVALRRACWNAPLLAHPPDNLPWLFGHPSCGNPLHQMLYFVRSNTKQAFTLGRCI